MDARAVSLLLRSRANVHAIGDSVKDAEMWPVWVGWKYWTWCVWWVSNILTDVKLSKITVVRMLSKKHVEWRSQCNSAGLHKSQTSYGLFEPVNLSGWLSRSTTLSDAGPCRCVHFKSNTWIVFKERLCQHCFQSCYYIPRLTTSDHVLRLIIELPRNNSKDGQLLQF